ncbi:hypothetical protein BSPA111_01190 [Buttiauxella sp. A111]|nr:hypothetical protein BSPA111_01190 [Buttiauxella sp. A111]
MEDQQTDVVGIKQAFAAHATFTAAHTTLFVMVMAVMTTMQTVSFVAFMFRTKLLM